MRTLLYLIVFFSVALRADFLDPEGEKILRKSKECHLTHTPVVVHSSKLLCPATITCDSAPTPDWAIKLVHQADENGRCAETAADTISESTKYEYPKSFPGKLTEKQAWTNIALNKRCTIDLSGAMMLLSDAETAPLCWVTIGCKTNGSSKIEFEELACPNAGKERTGNAAYLCPDIKKCWNTRVRITKPGPDSIVAKPRSRNTAVEASTSISAGQHRSKSVK